MRGYLEIVGKHEHQKNETFHSGVPRRNVGITTTAIVGINMTTTVGLNAIMNVGMHSSTKVGVKIVTNLRLNLSNVLFFNTSSFFVQNFRVPPNFLNVPFSGIPRYPQILRMSVQNFLVAWSLFF